ncbi:DUF2474 family protein [Marinicella litoralis]|nr:DUF2474 family protein [Marinicella litoralis]
MKPEPKQNNKGKQWLWFALIWLASVCCLFTISYVIRLALL